MAVAGVEGPEGPLVCAGSSLLEFKRGALDELARVPSTYRIGAMYAGFISSPGYFDGAVQLSGGDLVLVRDVFGPESPDVFSHHELVVMSLAELEAPPRAIIAAPLVAFFGVLPDTNADVLVSLSLDDSSGTWWLTAERNAGRADHSEAWTHELDGSVGAVAVSGSGEQARVGVLWMEQAGAGDTDTPRLDVFDVDGALDEQRVTMPAYDRPSALHPYFDGDIDGWIAEWQDDSGDHITLTLGDSTTELSGGDYDTAHDRILAIGDLVKDLPGEELLMLMGRGDSESRRAVIAAVTSRGLKVITDLQEQAVGSAVVLDVDGDGLLEVAGTQGIPGATVNARGEGPGRVFVWRFNADGTLESALHSDTYERGVSSLGSIDLDGDGVLEILAGYERGAAESKAYVDVLEIDRPIR
ncbi:MAG: VCBS repeat-containing protein [Coriobacteriia bacterium]|nr:VCBS repeat-containing protein [Coriobacteriia bacterium]